MAAQSGALSAGLDLIMSTSLKNLPLRGRFALLPMRDEVVTVEHVRELMDDAHVGST